MIGGGDVRGRAVEARGGVVDNMGNTVWDKPAAFAWPTAAEAVDSSCGRRAAREGTASVGGVCAERAIPEKKRVADRRPNDIEKDDDDKEAEDDDEELREGDSVSVVGRGGREERGFLAVPLEEA